MSRTNERQSMRAYGRSYPLYRVHLGKRLTPTDSKQTAHDTLGMMA